MKKILSRFADPESVFHDARLRLFQRFVCLLLRKLPELGKLQEPESFESLRKELLAPLSDERRRYADVFGEEPFLVQCGLADELLQKHDWAGKEWWKKNLLELQLYKSRTIGDRFYQIADRLLESRRRNDLPLAIILLDSLALGFHGRLTENTADEARWNRYRDDLGSWIRGMIDVRDLHVERGEEEIKPSTENVVLPGIPSVKPWYVLAVVAFFGMLVLSHFLWQSSVASVRDAVYQATARSYATFKYDAEKKNGEFQKESVVDGGETRDTKGGE